MYTYSPVGYRFNSSTAYVIKGNYRGKGSLAGFKHEGETRLPNAIPYAPAHGSGDSGIGSLFALNPNAMAGGTYLRPGGYQQQSNSAPKPADILQLFRKRMRKNLFRILGLVLSGNLDPIFCGASRCKRKQ